MYQSKDIIIDFYQNEDFNVDIKKITNPEIINRINDIKSNKNIIF